MAKYFYVSIGILAGLSLIILMAVVKLDKVLFAPTEVVAEPSRQLPLPATKKEPAPPARPRRQANSTPPPEEPSRESKAPSSTALNLRLAGTSFWGKTASAIIEDLTEGKQRSYRLGDTIQGFMITDISKESVTLAKNGQNIVLEVTKSTAPLPSEKLAWKIDDTHWGVSTEQVTEKIRNIDQYQDQLAVYQHYENDKTAGFAIHHLAEGNDIEAMGIEDGDIIKAVNGLEINDMTDVLKAVYELSAASEFEVAIERNNETKTISYKLDESSNLLLPILDSLFEGTLGGE